MDQIIIYQI